MASTAVAFPILPGKEAQAREFAEQVSGPRRSEMSQSLKYWGVQKENWYVQQGPQGSMLVVYLEADSPKQVFINFANSAQPFDRWFKDQAQAVTGIDFNEPPAALPEMVYGSEG